MSQSSDITIYFDGACEPVNPGGTATAGWYILDEQGNEIATGYQVVKRGNSATNNVAEWCALGLALRRLLDEYKTKCHNKTLTIHGDSKLVCNQLTRSWNCNTPHLQKLRDRCWEILEQLELKNWQAEWIPREKNEKADALSKRAYIECTGKQPPNRPRRVNKT